MMADTKAEELKDKLYDLSEDIIHQDTETGERFFEISENELVIFIQAEITKARTELLDELLQFNGAYIGIDGKRVENMVHHDVIEAARKRIGEEKR